MSEAEAIEKNRAFVIQRARRYMGWGVPLDDLIQEGCMGLLHAFRKWDPSRASLLTYARRWIDVYIRNAVGTSHNGKLQPRPVDASLDDTTRYTELTLHDLLPASGPSPEDIVAGREQLEKVTRRLTKREQEVIGCRFVDGRTLHETGKRFGLTRERARQIQEEALDEITRKAGSNAA